MRSSETLMLSSSRVVSSILLLFCDQNNLSMPLLVIHNRALLEGFGCQGPKACTKELS
jgi:peroxiredoxin